MIDRHCPGCGLEFSVPEPPARGSTRVWCSEGCNRRTQRDRRTLEFGRLLTFHAKTVDAMLPDVREAIGQVWELLGPEIDRARERQRVMLERTQPKPKRARRARKGAPTSQT